MNSYYFSACGTLQSHSQTSIQSSLLTGQNVRWPHCMLPPGESWRICLQERQKDRRQTVTLHFPLDGASVTKSQVLNLTTPPCTTFHPILTSRSTCTPVAGRVGADLSHAHETPSTQNYQST